MKILGVGVPSTSDAFSLNKTDVVKLARNSGVVALLAVITYLSGVFTPEQLGVWSPIVVIATAAITDFLNKWKAANVG